MSRRTAHDKLRVAHELERRPLVRERFAAGGLSYSKVRAITRVKDADDETDRRLLELADSGTAADLDRVARHFEQLEEQERGVDDYLRRYDRRTVRASRTYDGMMVLEHVLPIEEGEEYLALLEAVDQSSAEGMCALTNTARGRAKSHACNSFGSIPGHNAKEAALAGATSRATETGGDPARSK